MSAYLLELDGDQAAIIRLLKSLLKTLGRVHGVKCRCVAPATDRNPQ